MPIDELTYLKMYKYMQNKTKSGLYPNGCVARSKPYDKHTFQPAAC